MIFFSTAANSGCQDSIISINGQVIKLCCFKYRCELSKNCRNVPLLSPPPPLFFLAQFGRCFFLACFHGDDCVLFLFKVLPEFLQVEAFAKLSSAIGRVSCLSSSLVLIEILKFLISAYLSCYNSLFIADNESKTCGF